MGSGIAARVSCNESAVSNTALAREKKAQVAKMEAEEKIKAEEDEAEREGNQAKNVEEQLLVYQVSAHHCLHGIVTRLACIQFITSD